MPLDLFSEATRAWFQSAFAQPTAPQVEGWPAIASGEDTLICAPTGSGKTLAAFLWAIDSLVARAARGDLGDETAVIYVSPMKALGNDVQRNLEVPLQGIRAELARRGESVPELRVAVRSGDTPGSERQRMLRRPPHILITTPESLYILLTSEGSRKLLQTASTVIVDEIHAVAGDKRGAHLALTLERLDHLAGRRLQRVGLSATQKPLERVARLLTGADGAGRPRPCRIVDAGHRRDWDLSVWVPSQPLGPIASSELRSEVLDEIARLASQQRSTIVFANTRKLVERVAHQLTERLGEGRVAAHHGSLSRQIRMAAEAGLKSGTVPVIVATASLELGIDVGHVELVCHLGAPRAIATLLQRVGRSGHAMGAVPRGILFPLTRDELFQCAAAVRAARAGEMDTLIVPRRPLDVLAQQMVATCAAGEMREEELWDLVRRAEHYRDLERPDFEALVEMLSEGVSTSRGRRSAWLHRDRINGWLRARRGARLAAITSGGAIPDLGDYEVIEDPTDTVIGKVNEDFAIESSQGDVFLLGNSSWRVKRVEPGRVRVTDAHGLPPSVPFWVAEAPARSAELSLAVSDLRQTVVDGLTEPDRLQSLLATECRLTPDGVEQVTDYVKQTVATLGCVPTQGRIVAERFFDESGGMQLVIHSPFGARINRAWGMALRKRFCVTFDFELQAAATDDGVLLSLGEQHSFPLESVLDFVSPANLRESLVQAVLQSPIFATRFRWNASRALAMLRHQSGRRVPVAIQRMRAEDLIAAVFPEQVGCQDNHGGAAIVPPDHPLVNETMDNCLEEWMDMNGLEAILRALRAGEIDVVTVETPEPSQMSHELLSANPYAFLDDAPLEERRSRAVALRRIDPELARGAGVLDAAAIAEIRRQARPDVRDPDDLHDLLLSAIVISAAEVADGWDAHAAELIASGRAARARWTREHHEYSGLVAAERMSWLAAAVGDLATEPELVIPPALAGGEVTAAQAHRSMTQGLMERAGPLTVAQAASSLQLAESDVLQALLALENSGVVLRGSFTPGTAVEEWCDRRLLARIHRLTVNQLRREVVAVSPADHVRFLLRWQHLQPGTQLHGREGLRAVIRQLQGYEAPAASWESDLLSARVVDYQPEELEYLCLSGQVAWGRLSPDIDLDAGVTEAGGRQQATGRATSISFVLREDLPALAGHRAHLPASLSPAAAEVAAYLEQRGASFLDDIARGLGRLATEVEDVLWELVAAGVVTGDGVAGLRRLLGPRDRGHGWQSHRRTADRRPVRALPVGRWHLWREPSGGSAQPDVEAFARQLLARYGVVFRELLARERRAPSWNALLAVYRRLEACQDIRGGRFVSGFVGEQYALPEAVTALRAVRNRPPETEPVLVAAADCLNLAGILLPGARISPLSGQVVALRSGVMVDAGSLGEVRSRLRAESPASVSTSVN